MVALDEDHMARTMRYACMMPDMKPTLENSSRSRGQGPRIAGRRSSTKVKVTQQGGGSSDFWKLSEHLLAFSGLAILGAVGVKIIRVSHQDLATALTVATQSSPSTILLGSVLLFFPALAPMALMLGFVVTRRLMKTVRQNREAHRAPLVLVGYLFVAMMIVVCAIAVPATYVVAVLLFGACNRLLHVIQSVLRKRLPVRARTKPAHPHRAALLGEVVLVGLLVVGLAPIVYAAANDVVWLPSLELKVRGQRSAFVGYEISATSSRVTILRDSDRQVVFIDPKDITSERPCELRNLVNNQRSLWSVLVRAPAPGTPKCLSHP
jgi:hypothetical protein